LQEFYRCEEGKEQQAEYVLENVCKKLVHDIHYEARVQAVVDYYINVKEVEMKKRHARTKYLDKEQYMKVIYMELSI
jgi:hypothetical protein